MSPVRRTLLIAPLLAIVPALARAQSVTEGALDKLVAYFGAAAALAGGAAAAANRVKPSQFKANERPAIGAQINELNNQLTLLRSAQGVMLGDMGDYISSVRAHGYKDDEHGPMWSGIIGQMRDISTKVEAVDTTQRNAAWLKVALSAQDEQALSDTLRARVSLLDQLRALPAPRTPIEIDKLAALHQRYLKAAEKLNELRLALAKAKRRFG